MLWGTGFGTKFRTTGGDAKREWPLLAEGSRASVGAALARCCDELTAAAWARRRARSQ
jgi:hypothetical protein